MHRSKNMGVLLFMLVTGVLIGSLLGAVLSRFIPLLSYGPGPLGIKEFGIDLSIISFQLSLLIDLNLAGLLGVIIAVLIFKKL
ncbi:DUF4321 domain-containing protein [Anoxynatronum buryatiense]|uniref:DUF4321 domain-containing protein n=1 Tax=Anoxynatronum buryatiense TaxID=489973 RepID=A0AA45WUY7_9CLOT|nr:DUF4321 domain-containing protein [Anoxynatronum buryatiense]SMP49739.1 protein of unknown function [Anoxynatronum buryatiense]